MIVQKFRLYPSKSQMTSIKKQMDVHKNLYNLCLEKKNEQYENTKKSDGCFTQIKNIIPEFRKNNPLSRKCSYSSLQQTVRRLHKSFQKIYTKTGGRPRFKKGLNSIEFGKHGDGWKVNGNELYVIGVGNIKINISNCQITNNLQRLILKFDNDRFEAFLVSSDVRQIKSDGNGEIGIDFGLRDFLTLSNGEKIKALLPLKRKLKDVGRIQRQIEKAKNKYQKELKRKALRKIHKKIANQRKDFLHKLTLKLVRENSKIAIEDLKLTNFNSFSPINRTWSDTAISIFVNLLSYKAESAGVILKKVNPAYTSQTCSRCGKIHEIDLKERTYVCSCGYIEDRDINAAKNIFNLAFNCGITQFREQTLRSPRIHSGE